MSRQRLRPSLGESSQIVCPRCSGQGTIRDIEPLSLAVLRLLEEEALKDNTGKILAKIPVECATYLLNEKRDKVEGIEQRCKVHLVVIPDPKLETPHFEIERVKDNDTHRHESNYKKSYELTTEEEPVDLAEISSSQTSSGETAAVQRVNPPAHKPMPKQEKQSDSKAGILKRLSEILFGNGDKPEEQQESKDNRNNENRNRSRRGRYRGNQNRNRNNASDKKASDAARQAKSGSKQGNRTNDSDKDQKPDNKSDSSDFRQSKQNRPQRSRGGRSSNRGNRSGNKQDNAVKSEQVEEKSSVSSETDSQPANQQANQQPKGKTPKPREKKVEPGSTAIENQTQTDSSAEKPVDNKTKSEPVATVKADTSDAPAKETSKVSADTDTKPAQPSVASTPASSEEAAKKDLPPPPAQNKTEQAPEAVVKES